MRYFELQGPHLYYYKDDAVSYPLEMFLLFYVLCRKPDVLEKLT